MAKLDLRPRSVTEIVDAAFQLLRREYVTLITIAAVIQSVLLVLQIYMGPDVLNPLHYSDHIGAFIFLLLVNMVAFAVSDAAVIEAASESYEGRKPSVPRALGRLIVRGFSLVIASVIRGVGFYVGLFLLVAPGAYLYSRLAVLPAVIVLEGKGPFASIGRSWRLAEDLVWPTFLTMVLAVVIYWALGLVFTLGVSVLGTVVPLFSQPNVSVAVGRLAAVFAYPIIGVVTMLIYYDCRVRKEALDLEMMMRALEADRELAPAVGGGRRDVVLLGNAPRHDEGHHVGALALEPRDP